MIACIRAMGQIQVSPRQLPGACRCYSVFHTCKINITFTECELFIVSITYIIYEDAVVRTIYHLLVKPAEQVDTRVLFRSIISGKARRTIVMVILSNCFPHGIAFLFMGYPGRNRTYIPYGYLIQSQSGNTNVPLGIECVRIL